jgi:hypothetical protein
MFTFPDPPKESTVFIFKGFLVNRLDTNLATQCNIQQDAKVNKKKSFVEASNFARVYVCSSEIMGLCQR